MPNETEAAVTWALSQTVTNIDGITIAVTSDTPIELVDKVREYFNTNNIEYSTFSYDDLVPYL